MHLLLTALAVWSGRRPTQSLMETKGYFLPARYKETVLANSSNCDEAALDRYWDEVALEHLCSAGRVVSDRRTFGGATAYRSEYLDALAELEENRNRGQPGLPLDRCLYAFRARYYTPSQGAISFGRLMANQTENHKKEEIRRLDISASEWTGAKADFRTFLQKIAEQRGFALRKRRWRKRFGDNLEFSCGIDCGMQRTWTFQLPLTFEIVHTLAPDLTFNSDFFEPLMPGFHYHHYNSPESAVLGIQAHVDLFDTIGELIATAARSAA